MGSTSARIRAALCTLVVLAGVAGCTATVSGHGGPASTAQTISASGPSFASTPAETPAAPTSSAAAPTTAAPTKTAPTKTALSRARIVAQLAGLTPGRKDTIVIVPGALEAAVYDQAGHVTFWRHASAWTQVGSSTYPYDATFFPAPLARMSGALLSGMAHATFIATGLFSGDGSGNAVAFTTGAKGWGAIKAESNGNIGPSGQGVAFSAIGLSDGFAFSHGLLESADCSSTGPISACGGSNRVFKYWRWAGHDFVLHSRAGLAH